MGVNLNTLNVFHRTQYMGILYKIIHLKKFLKNC